MIGIDRGVANTIATSDGDMFQAPTLTAGECKRFLALEQQAARQRAARKRAAKQQEDGKEHATGKHVNSRRYEKTIKDLGKLRLRLDDRRADWIEQTTTLLARQYDYVAFEGLNIPGMTKRVPPKPDPDQSGQYVPNGQAAKSGLNKAILGSCWGKFAQRLGHKTVTDPDINPRNTSRECNECHHVEAANRKSQAEFECQQCGHEAHADVNAAKNVLGRGRNKPTQHTNPRTVGARTRQPRKSRVNHLAA